MRTKKRARDKTRALQKVQRAEDWLSSPFCVSLVEQTMVRMVKVSLVG